MTEMKAAELATQEYMQALVLWHNYEMSEEEFLRIKAEMKSKVRAAGVII